MGQMQKKVNEKSYIRLKGNLHANEAPPEIYQLSSSLLTASDGKLLRSTMTVGV